MFCVNNLSCVYIYIFLCSPSHRSESSSASLSLCFSNAALFPSVSYLSTIAELNTKWWRWCWWFSTFLHSQSLALSLCPLISPKNVCIIIFSLNKLREFFAIPSSSSSGLCVGAWRWYRISLQRENYEFLSLFLRVDWSSDRIRIWIFEYHNFHLTKWMYRRRQQQRFQRVGKRRGRETLRGWIERRRGEVFFA